MSYSEENGLVILSMSREDYDTLLMLFGMASGLLTSRGESLARILELLNRLNEGNPNHTPYQVEAKK